MTVIAENPSQTFSHIGEGWSRGALPTSLDSASTVVLACGTLGDRQVQGAVQELRGAFRSSSIIGCSGWSEVGQDPKRSVLQVAVCKFRKARLSLASAPLRSIADSFRAGQLLAQQLTTPSLRAILLFADGGRSNGTQMLRGLHASIGERVQILGGLAGIEPAEVGGAERSWVVRDGVATDGFVTALGFYGQGLVIEQTKGQAWRGVGPVRKVTRARDNVVHELDGRGIVEVYQAYAGFEDADSIAMMKRLPLQMITADGTVLRTVRHVDVAQRSISFTGDVPEGSLVQIAFAPATDACVPEGMDVAALMSAPGLRLTCAGQVRSTWETCGVSACQSADQEGIASAIIGTLGEFARSSSGQLELRGGSRTVTVIREET